MSAQENYEKLLSAQHGRTIDFVKFAEAKNAALLTFCSVWIGSIVAMLRTERPLPLGFDTALKIALPMLFVAALVALTSFLPRRLHHFVEPDDRDGRNLLYFGDIAKLKIGACAERLRERYHPSEGAAYSDRYLDDLAVQISVQSRIADAKFKAFNTAAVIVLAGFAVVTTPPLLCLGRAMDRKARRAIVRLIPGRRTADSHFAPRRRRCRRRPEGAECAPAIAHQHQTKETIDALRHDTRDTVRDRGRPPGRGPMHRIQAGGRSLGPQKEVRLRR